MLQPSFKEGERFIKSGEGKILYEFLRQQENVTRKWC